MKKRICGMVAAVCLMFVTGCAQVDGNKGKYGAVGGAAAGALLGQAIGHDTESTLIGTGVGIMLGYIVGNEMDKYDQQQMQSAFERGVSNQPVAWTNPNTQSAYVVTPQHAYQNQTGQYCRVAQIQATIDGQPAMTETTACRDANGIWQLQSS